MRFEPWVQLMVFWFAWLYPFLFQAPHFQKRPSVTVSRPSLLGLLFEGLAIFIAFVFRLPGAAPPGPERVWASAIFGVLAAALSWTSVRHLGRQFRIRAGLYEDHRLIRTGPYALVRHPIFASLLAALLSTLLLLTPWRWCAVSLALFLVGTEIRIRTEERLLATRFPDEFVEYRRSVPAYLPFLR
jgi:protein-S-isoprenylcysteine O-methyltransferase Ste14